ncbi:MAG: hypothetical protein DWQ01_13930 [Planctomycetota bacterium]|nr:MAG: hypothetical protein DWQ01_13930 [Planctomycetota bacterium]
MAVWIQDSWRAKLLSAFAWIGLVGLSGCVQTEPSSPQNGLPPVLQQEAQELESQPLRYQLSLPPELSLSEAEQWVVQLEQEILLRVPALKSLQSRIDRHALTFDLHFETSRSGDPKPELEALFREHAPECELHRLGSGSD